MATPSSSVSEAIVASTEGDKTDSEHTSPRPTDSKEDVQGKRPIHWHLLPCPLPSFILIKLNSFTN